MIQKLILINSANFNFLEVNLEKDLFFLGDNGSGKTTVIRAIHYLFSGDVRNLGIPTDKDGFKEYYFRYPNSYMIYVFEDFFIFMYKTSGEIVKLFSKQQFDLSRIIDEASNLYELDVIKKYAKIPNMKKTVKSLSEYRDIIYGNDKRYLDFKFTSIKNSSVFIGLFNEIFNIDKSIIDSKSIKRAIQTTLNSEKKVLEFEHDKYLQSIYTFQSQYKFFREFEKQKENVESAYEIKNRLLAYEEELHTLLAYILFKSTQERELLDASNLKHIKIEARYTRAKKLKQKRQTTFTKCEAHYKLSLNSLTLDIQEIKGLKEKFSKESLLLHRDSADKYEEIQERYSEVNEQYIKIKSGFENEMDSIDSEIKSLRYKRDRELPREQENKKENRRKFLKTEVDEKIEREELAFATKESIAKSDIETILAEIKLFNEDIVSETRKLNAYSLKSKQEVKNINENYENEERKKKVAISDSEDFIDAKRREVKELAFTKEELERDRERTLRINRESFESEQKEVMREIEKYTRMISAKPNSFKEFLNEEADGWESELYPFMDESILDVSVEELHPVMLEQERLLSIKIDTKNLKKILTKDEASVKIERYQLELENLKLSYDKAVQESALAFKEAVEKIEQKILFLQSDIETKRESILQLTESLRELTTSRERELKEFNDVYSKQYKEYQNSITAFHDEIQNSRDTIDAIQERLKEDKQSLINRVKDLEEEFVILLKREYKELERWLESEKLKIDAFIKIQEEKRSSITQDERVKELENSLNLLEIDRTRSMESKLFLKEYEKSQARIETLLSLENLLINMKLKFNNFTLRIEQKIEAYEYEIEELSEEKRTLLRENRLYKKGLDSFVLVEFDFNEIEGRDVDKYLYELVERFNALSLEYKNRKIDLKSKLDRLNRLKNSHSDVDIYFNFDTYDDELYISKSLHIVTKIDEVYEYKNKKLIITKESGNKQFRNFVKNSLPQNMLVFNDSEDKFISQVAKINKNLSGIDFGVIKDIKLNPKVGDKKSIAKLLTSLNESVATLSSLLNENSLFYEQSDVLAELTKLEMKFKEIKAELKGSTISLDDTIDLSLSFVENEKQITQVSQLKNESSTGGSMLLKIAIAISILQLFSTEEKTPFFLIVDEVSRLHSDNQEKLRTFANSKGFGIVFVTPEPTYSKPEFIKYYRFQKNSDNEFEAIELNV